MSESDQEDADIPRFDDEEMHATTNNNGNELDQDDNDDEQDDDVDPDAGKEYDIDDEPDAEDDNDNNHDQSSSASSSAHPNDAAAAEPPSYAAANRLPFYWLCARMEKIWQLKYQATRNASSSSLPGGGFHRNNNQQNTPPRHVTDEEKLQCLLPPHELQRFDQSWNKNAAPQPGGGGEAGGANGGSSPPSSSRPLPPQSLFPILRLLLSEKDSSRSFNIKENLLAKAYVQAFQLGDNNQDALKLFRFTDPVTVGTDRAGDFSRVVQAVLEPRIVVVDPENNSSLSFWTVGDVNQRLDELVTLPAKAQALKQRLTNHDWRVATAASSPASRKRRKGPTLQDLRADWIRRLNTPQQLLQPHAVPTQAKKLVPLSPLEHKWLVRIILGKLQLGLGWTRIFNWYHPSASALWSSHNSLKGVCRILCDAKFSAVSSREDDGTTNDPTHSHTPRRDSYMPRTKDPVQFGVPFEPMLSERTSFARALTNLSTRHRDLGGTAAAQQHRAEHLLALRHPVFSVETKLDGERMLIHFRRDGVVQIHSRRGKWHSVLYSPVLGPALRRAIGRHAMDLILDGEVLAWDSGRNETVPFGNNGTIARLRQKWMRRKGLCDERDFGLHASDKEIKSVGPSGLNSNKDGEFDESAGEECWLVFYAFDIVYLNGPGAQNVLDTVVSPCITPRPSPGSLIDLDCIERKKLLYSLVEVQEHEVEIVETMIVRPNGRVALGSQYFASTACITECGVAAHTLDSIECNLCGAIPELARIDVERRRGLSDEEISEARARALEKIYKRTVEDQRLEGLLFKDLAAPYCLGAASKSLRYWLKFKPDYFNGSAASDLDLVICGAYFAAGLRSAGKPSSFLCACVDSEDDQLFLPVCKVSAGSMDENTKASLLTRTGFRHVASSESHASVEYGNWFKGNDGDWSIPDFISSRSYQNGNEDGGWRVTKAEYPDLWIRPDQSAVVTLNAGEIVVSDVFSAGLTLRFPRITKLRDGADDKKLYDIENDRKLWAIFQEVMESRASDTAALVIGSPSKVDGKQTCRFLTEQQFAATNKAKKSRNAKRRFGIPMPTDTTGALESQALKGIEFTVLDGNYGLERNSIDEDQAKLEGWYNSAQSVQSSMCVKSFIKKHGGQVKVSICKHDTRTVVIGGREDDARVRNYVSAIENALRRAPELSRKTKKAIDNAALARHAGVVRWTFVYSVVQRWTSRQNRAVESVDESRSLPEPKYLDYLVRPSVHRERRIPEDIEILDTVTLNRALEVVKLKRRAIGPPGQISWHQIASTALDPDKRFIMSCGPGKALWHRASDGTTDECNFILYADIYSEIQSSVDGSNYEDEDVFSPSRRMMRPENEIGSILSVLPLARVMGLRITPVLDSRVTHVLVAHVPEGASNDKSIIVDMLQPTTSLAGRTPTTSHQQDADPASRLLLRFSDLHVEAQQERKVPRRFVRVISPGWIRESMWKGSSGMDNANGVRTKLET